MLPEEEYVSATGYAGVKNTGRNLTIRIGSKLFAIEKCNGDWSANGALPQLPTDKYRQSSDSLTPVGLLIPEVGNRVIKRWATFSTDVWLRFARLGR